MTTKANKEERIEIRISTELKERLDNAAKLIQTSRSDVLRIALEQYCTRVESDDRLKEALEIISQYK